MARTLWLILLVGLSTGSGYARAAPSPLWESLRQTSEGQGKPATTPAPEPAPTGAAQENAKAATPATAEGAPPKPGTQAGADQAAAPAKDKPADAGSVPAAKAEPAVDSPKPKQPAATAALETVAEQASPPPKPEEKPAEPRLGDPDFRRDWIEFFDPDIRLGSIIARDIPITQLLREIGREKKVNLVVDRSITTLVNLELADADTGLNHLLNLLVYLYPLSCERVGGFVYMRPIPRNPNLTNDILYDHNTEEIAFDLRGIRLADLAKDLIESCGKNVLLESHMAGGGQMIRGYQAKLPFEQGLATLMSANGLGLRVNNGVYTIGRVQGVRKRDGLIDIWFEDAPIDRVLKELVDLNQVPLMVLDKLEGQVSIDIQGVDVEHLLRLLADNNGFSYRFQDGIYLIGKAIPPDTVIVHFDQVHAEIVKAMLPESLTQNVTVMLLKEHNSLLFTGELTRVESLAAIAENLDKRVAQVLIEVIMVQFNLDDSSDLGVTITSGDGQEIFPNLNLGFDGYRDSNGSYQITRLPTNFSLAIRALQKNGKAKVITKPHIATLSGNEANLKIGTTLAYRINSEEIVGDQNPRVRTTEKIEFVEANTSLKITPWVMNDDLLTVSIQTEFNTFGGAVVDNVPPQQNTNSMISTVRLRNGETIILGGLLVDSQSLTHEGVPFLSKIPLLGALFRNRSKATLLNEMVLYITPHIYLGAEESGENADPENLLDYRLRSLRKANRANAGRKNTSEPAARVETKPQTPTKTNTEPDQITSNVGPQTTEPPAELEFFPTPEDYPAIIAPADSALPPETPNRIPEDQSDPNGDPNGDVRERALVPALVPDRAPDPEPQSRPRRESLPHEPDPSYSKAEMTEEKLAEEKLPRKTASSQAPTELETLEVPADSTGPPIATIQNEGGAAGGGLDQTPWISVDSEAEPMPAPAAKPPGEPFFAEKPTDYAALSRQMIADLKRAEAHYGIAFMVACQQETLDLILLRRHEAAFSILPRSVGDEACYVLVWGAFKTRSEANRMLSQLPHALRFPDARPWVFPLDEAY